MLVYNYETEDGVLYHHGIKGMKWGVRRNLSNLKTSKTTKYISKNPQDIALYGHRGANKIKKIQDTKGYTHAKAKRRYNARRLATVYTTAAVAAPVATAIGLYGAENVRKAAVNSGKKVVDGLIKKRFNMEILDASGRVIKRYRDKGVRVVADMLTR